jgi:FSR family fosmidomycin resistance protein-like MFS transporter
LTSPYKGVFSLFLAHLVTDIYTPVITAILPLFISVFGFSYFMAGLLVTAFNLTSSLTQPVFGWLSDEKGFEVHVSSSVLISAVFISLMGVISNYPLLLFCAAMAATGHACFHPNALSQVSRLAVDTNRGRITSIFVVGGNIGYALGPLMAGGVVFLLGLKGLLLLVIPAVIMAVVLRRIIPPASKKRSVPRTGTHGEGFLSVIKPIRTLFLASTFRAWAVFSAIAFFPPFLMERGLDIFTANLLVTLTLLAGVAGQLVGGELSDRYGRKEFVLAGLVLSIPALAAFLMTEGVISVLFLLAFGFFLWSSFSVTVAMSHEMVPRSVGIASGMMIGVAIGAGGVGVAFSGMIADSYSLISALATIPVLILLSAVLMSRVRYPWKLLAGRQ